MADTRKLTTRAATDRNARAWLLWWATACAAVDELQRSGELLLAEIGRGPMDTTALGDAITALVTASEELATACPRPAFFPDPLAGVPLE